MAAGFRSLAGFPLGAGQSGAAPAATAGFRGLLALWIGGSASPSNVPPTPPVNFSYGGGGWIDYDSKRRKKRWDAKLADQEELRRLIVDAMRGAKADPETAVQAKAIAKTYEAPRKENVPPRIDYDAILKNIEVVEWLLMTYQRRLDDDDDDSVFLLH